MTAFLETQADTVIGCATVLFLLLIAAYLVGSIAMSLRRIHRRWKEEQQVDEEG